MATGTFNKVEITGAANETQLQVKANAGQDQPIQTWEDHNNTVYAQVTADGDLNIPGDGRLLVGDDLGGATADALIEAHRAVAAGTTVPERGLNTLGRISGALSNVVHWVVQELELDDNGGSGISALQNVLRVALTNRNTGNGTDGQLRGASIHMTNDGGNSNDPIDEMVGLQVEVSNTANGHLDAAYGVRIDMQDASGGNGGQLYALHTKQGLIHFEDAQELKLFSAMPSTNPPANFIRLYPRLDAGTPKLYAKDTSGTEHVLGTGSGATQLDGLSDVSLTTPSVGDLLRYDGSGWVNAALNVTKTPLYVRQVLLVNTLLADGIWDVSNLEATYGQFDHLEILLRVRSNNSVTSHPLEIIFNNDVVTTNYHRQSIYGNNGGTGAAESATPLCAWISGNTAPTGAFTTVRIWLPDYRSQTLGKQAVTEYGQVEAADHLSMGQILTRWDSTNAIDRLTVRPSDYPNKKLLIDSQIQIIGHKQLDVVTDVTVA